MISNQVLAESLNKAADASGIRFSVLTADGRVVNAAGADPADETVLAAAREFLKGDPLDREPEEANGWLYFRCRENTETECVLFCKKKPEATALGKMMALQLETLLNYGRERFDKDNFMKNLLLDNLLIVDIYSRSAKLGLDVRTRRVAYLIETRTKDDTIALETVKNMFADNEDDFVTAIDESNIVVVRELKSEEDEANLMHVAETIADMLNMEAMSPVKVSFGNVADEIRKVSGSYKEAKLAMSVGKIFDPDKNVFSYGELGIGRLIYQLPIPMCKMFIEEIFKGRSPENFDDETLNTINEFFNNNLNVSETSRQLYIHRNTLVYRLDKLQKLTNLDIRTFGDAITFKIALMVVKYMHYMENQE